MQREEIQNERKRVGYLKTRVGWSAVLAEGARWTRLNSEVLQAEQARKGRHSVGMSGTFRKSREAARRTAPGVRAAQSFKSGEIE